MSCIPVQDIYFCLGNYLEKQYRYCLVEFNKIRPSFTVIHFSDLLCPNAH